MQDVVFLIRCRDQNQFRPQGRKHRTFHPGEPAGIDVLDGLQHHRRIETGELPVGRFERAIAHLHVSAWHQGIKIEHSPGPGDGLFVDVDADQALELHMDLETLQQFAGAAAQIQNAGCTGAEQFFYDCVESRAMQGCWHGGKLSLEPMVLEFLQPFINLLQAHPYLFIFAGMLVAGEVVLLPAVYLAATGRLDLAAVLSLAILATVVSDLAWYGLGRRFPAAALARIPGRHTSSVVRGLERLFTRKGAQVLFLSKFVYGTRTVAQVLAGVHDMPFRTYIAVNFMGVLALSATLAAIAYSVVGTTRQLGEFVDDLEIAFLVFVVIAVSANYLVSRLVRNRWSRS